MLVGGSARTSDALAGLLRMGMTMQRDTKVMIASIVAIVLTCYLSIILTTGFH